MRALLWALCAAALLVSVEARAQAEEEAGDVSEVDKDRTGPLRERVRPVSGHLFMKRGRFEFSPSATRSLNDAFFTKYVFGGTFGFFPSEEVGLHLRGGYALPFVSSAAQICPRDDAGGRTCQKPALRDLDGRAPGQMSWLAGADVSWSPLYGKVGLLAERFLHFDLYVLGGVSAVGYQGPARSEGGASVGRMSLGGNLGVGSRVVISRWMTLRAELRDLVYSERTGPAGVNSALRNQLMFELGFSMFLPTSFIPE